MESPYHAVDKEVGFLYLLKVYLVKQDLSQYRNSPTSFNGSTLIKRKMKLEGVVAAILIIAQVTSPLPLAGWDFLSILPANAVLYSPETKLPRTGELALRRAIPANTNMKAIQSSLEDLSYLLRIPQRKPYGTMEGNVKKALKIAVDGKDSILGSIPADLREKGSALYSSLIDGKGGVFPDEWIHSFAETSWTDCGTGLSFLLPEQYLNYPRLTGRAVVELTLEKGDGSSFSPEVGSEPRKTATIQVVLDGYSAPLTTGNFAKLNGYSVPLEIMPSGQFEPLYKTTLSVQDGELPVLPLSVYGAVAMAHSDVSEEYSSPYQFFFYLYDKRNSGLGGISFDEGQFSVFGYTTAGREILPQIRTGDVIKSAKPVEGRDHLVLPNES
ncbi:Peptidyl-prolyl cis-trans isomerase CYP37 [Hibiscus syriacus]|uniref:Peptidyl-prolyl cis-trans isomerase CYP37 n=1 Tax=Hibiscus syriacus TaxID=106335 RepID=A0A6A2YEB6_HIBSY|nr:Peptidyl-prolyl cis-trans isomerase CYP37 [Hibiscus syriacus]